MPVRVQVRLTAASDGTDISFHAVPEGKLSQGEIDIANTLICICNLISDEKFIDHISSWVDAELAKLHEEEKKEAHKGSGLVM